MRGKHLYTEKTEWKGKPFITELYECDDIKGLKPTTQVSAVCFLDLNTIVFSKKFDGSLTIPGGGVDEGETLEEAVAREMIEEAQLELIELKFIGYEYIINVEEPKKNAYFIRSVAKVKLIDRPIVDPCGKSINRVIIDTLKASEALNWGERGRLLIELGRKNIKRFPNN